LSTLDSINTSRTILVLGASGHAKVVLDMIEKAAKCKVGGLFDDNPALLGSTVLGYEVMGGKGDLLAQTGGMRDCSVVVAIGNNAIRASVAAELIANKKHLCEALIHPSAQIAHGVRIGKGCVVMAGAIINADSCVGNNVIVNTSATIDHDCIIGDGVHIAPGVTLCGGIKVGENTLVGAGAVVSPNLRIGSNVTIGAGATVLQDIDDGLTVVGSPARPIKLTK